MIEELKYMLNEDRFGNIYGKILPSHSQIVDKINEIIQYLNEKEAEK